LRSVQQPGLSVRPGDELWTAPTVRLEG
jgi:hypothetical protein